MTVEEITTDIKAVAAKAGTVDATFKFVFTDAEGEVIHVVSKGNTNVVTNDDLPADCELRLKTSTFEQLKSGKLKAPMALMMGKVKVKGDLGVAMKLQGFL